MTTIWRLFVEAGSWRWSERGLLRDEEQIHQEANKKAKVCVISVSHFECQSTPYHRFGGDISSYIAELSRMAFAAIKTTGEDYLTSFGDSSTKNYDPLHQRSSTTTYEYKFVFINLTDILCVYSKFESSSSHMSEFIVWATQELERFGTVFRRQGRFTSVKRLFSFLTFLWYNESLLLQRLSYYSRVLRNRACPL